MSSYLTETDWNIISSVRNILPDLNGSHHKGQLGRIGIIGGSQEYTGAPYFAGISALRVGADLVHVFCAKDAAQPIKSYSPDLIVHPLLDAPNAVEEISKWLERLHVLVIGPGLGQQPEIVDNVKRLLALDAMKEKRLVVDADGLKLIDSLQGLSCILTPNAIELQRLGAAADDSKFTILAKGKQDQIRKNGQTFQGPEFRGSGRRCGGQGDLISGAIAILLHWGTLAGVEDPDVIACRGASMLVRLCNSNAFFEKGRGALAEDMVKEITVVFKKYFDPSYE